MTTKVSLMKATLAALIAGLLVACSSGPPVQEMSDASQARALLQSAEAKLRRRAYNGAKVDAVEARRKAVEAHDEAEASKDQR